MAIPSQWYEICKLKKVEVITQLTARSIAHNITTHIMTLKSKLYQHIKSFVRNLRGQFNAIVGDDWTQVFCASGKTFKEFKKDLLRKFHPDLHNGSAEATEICQEINGWEEPIDYQAIIEEAYQRRYARWESKGEFTIHPLFDEYQMRQEVAQFMMGHYNYEYDFSSEPWCIQYMKEREERWKKIGTVALQFI